MSFCQDTSTKRWTVADVRQTFWVMTSSCILSVRNCREIQLLYLISSSQQSWHCAQQQANRSDGLVTVQTTKSRHPDDASPAPCCTAGSCTECSFLGDLKLKPSSSSSSSFVWISSGWIWNAVASRGFLSRSWAFLLVIVYVYLCYQFRWIKLVY